MQVQDDVQIIIKYLNENQFNQSHWDVLLQGIENNYTPYQKAYFLLLDLPYSVAAFGNPTTGGFIARTKIKNINELSYCYELNGFNSKGMLLTTREGKPFRDHINFEGLDYFIKFVERIKKDYCYSEISFV